MLQKVKEWWFYDKKANKILIVFSAFLIAFSIFLGCAIGSSMAANVPKKLITTREDFESGATVGLITGIYLSGKFLATDTTTGTQYVMYCLEKEKEWYVDSEMTNNNESLDAGYAYIIKNGYPNKEFTKNSDYDFYLTQVAIWWYQDRIAGVDDTEDGILTAAQKQEIKTGQYSAIFVPLVDKAVDITNNYRKIEPKFSVSTSSFKLDSTGKYLETSYISVTANVDFTSYSVALDMAGAQVINEQGLTTQGSIPSNQKFKIRIPVSSLSSSDLDLKVSVILDYEVDTAYQFHPPADQQDMQKAVPSLVMAMSKQYTASTTVRIPTGSITIEKVNATTDAPLAGAKIELVRNSDNQVIETFTTTTTAKTISGLLPGKYTIREIDAPAGFVASSNSPSVTLNTTNMNQTVRLENTPLDFKIRKIDEETKQPVAGAEIVILNEDSEEVFRFTSTSGYTDIPALEVGKYTAVEEKAPSGYYLNKTPVSFEIKDTDTSKSIDVPNKKNEIEILKTDADTGSPLAGAKLRVVNTANNETVEEWTTTTTAHVIRGLAAGNYRVEEVSAPSGYVLNTNSMSFTVSNTQTEKIKITFPNTKSQIMISKVNEAGELIAGAKLAIYNSSNQKVQEFTSKTTPTIIDKLAAGNYTLREEQAPSGYTLNTEPVPFEVTDSTRNLQISMKNVQNEILIGKVDADTKAYISGAELRLVSESGAEIRKWTSTNSLYSIKGLAAGTYYLEETKAPTGYIRNTERIEIVVNENTTTVTYTMENQSISVRIGKIDKDTKQLVAGATLELLDENRDVISTWQTSTDYQLFNDLKEGKYYVREKTAPAGYILNNETVEFTIDATHTSFVVELENEQTTVKLGKIDAQTGDYLPGATLQLSREDGSMDPITFVSEDKATEFKGLASGSYVLEEISAPAGYIETNSKITFEVDSTGKTKNISLKSDYITVSVQDKKLQIDTKGVAGYEFELLNANGELLDTYEVGEEVFTSNALENGYYLLKQTKVPEGMVLNSNLYSFTISDTQTSDVVYFANDYTRVNFEKKEMIGGKNLAGAHFILRNEQGDIVEEWTSTDTAKTIEKLTPGQYTLSEVQAPDGYVLNKSALTFEVAKTGDIQVVTMFDALEVKVPNTSQNSLLYLFIGTITIMTGLSIFGYTYYKKKA